MRASLLLVAVVGVLGVPRIAQAATYAVGPGRAYPDLASVARILRPGDRVEVDGGVTYPGGVIFREPGAPGAPITVVGRRVDGRRPVIAGGVTTVEVRADHYVIEGLEIEGGSSRCFFHHADDVTVRDTVIHDCPGHGVLGADDDAGSLTLAYVEIYRAGRGDGAHSVYMATDEEAHPGAVFRMEHCFVHDATGGNAVKSRAERNEIYSNWIDGAPYHALELVGPDGEGRKRAREDSDVVGNVLRKGGSGYAIRVGGDGSGETFGRYRFVNNTILLGPEARAAFRLFNGLSSIVMHNNAIARRGGGPLTVLVEQDVRWAGGRALIAGANNWVPMGSTGVPTAWVGTHTGRDPGLVSDDDPRPAPGSPLIGAGASAPEEPPGCALRAPLAMPAQDPPRGALERVGSAAARIAGPVDIGAFQYRAPARPHVGAGVAPPAPPRGGCGCRGGPAGGTGWRRSGGVALAALAGAMRARRSPGRKRRAKIGARPAARPCPPCPASSACSSSRTCGRTSSSRS